MSNWQALISSDAVQGWFIFSTMILMLTCLLVESFRHPAHYRLRQRPAKRRSGLARTPTPGESAQRH